MKDSHPPNQGHPPFRYKHHACDITTFSCGFREITERRNLLGVSINKTKQTQNIASMIQALGDKEVDIFDIVTVFIFINLLIPV